jgi:hypothetical protein
LIRYNEQQAAEANFISKRKDAEAELFAQQQAAEGFFFFELISEKFEN